MRWSMELSIAIVVKVVRNLDVRNLDDNKFRWKTDSAIVENRRQCDGNRETWCPAKLSIAKTNKKNPRTKRNRYWKTRLLRNREPVPKKTKVKKKNTNQKNQETEHLWIPKQRGETGRRNAANDGEDDRFRPEKRKKKLTNKTNENRGESKVRTRRPVRIKKCARRIPCPTWATVAEPIGKRPSRQPPTHLPGRNLNSLRSVVRSLSDSLALRFGRASQIGRHTRTQQFRYLRTGPMRKRNQVAKIFNARWRNSYRSKIFYQNKNRRRSRILIVNIRNEPVDRKTTHTRKIHFHREVLG